ncbi:fused FliR family export protein/FlhB family type III secretion system protein [Clostridium sp. JN-9]|uniref:fused FliR family export protein/FlhB family type III secretion system protein n=1 Tax=Clostridium sp. JN-9 TaxID=2507159 RepID=UPI000FFE2984|nr:fused FliR family export protein/FlhB family type III secretion system protein [Clostridium sp. JN-9]QAT39963.1 fused FliR family export protein/FlhB family type III secretion system protein [Clostridium sp. JN-9]
MINVAYFTALIFVFIRLTAFFVTVPVFFPKGTPIAVKTAVVLVLSYALMPGVYTSNVPAINSMGLFVTFAINEVITGLTLGFITNLCFNFIRFAGSLIDLQIGFGMITMYDPNSNSNTTLMEHLMYWIGIIIFLTIDGHHMLIRQLIDSFNYVHIGGFVLYQDSIREIVKAFAEFFAIGIKIAIPIVLIILLTDLTLGLVARAVPQLNVMILGLPIKIVVGLAVFSLALPLIINLIVKSFTSMPDVFKNFYKTMPVLLIFATEGKTEEATPRKKSDARKKAQVAKSKEVGLAMTLLASTLAISILGEYSITSLKDTLTAFLGNYLNTTLDYGSVLKITLLSIYRIAVVFLPIVLPIMFMGILANFVQTGVLFSKDPIKPDFKKLNPINGFKRMFSIRSFVELFKDLAMVVIVGYVGYTFIRDNYVNILTISNMTPAGILKELGKLIVSIFTKITIIMMAIALADYIFQRFQYNKDMKMTKQEVKEEYKQDEGDPEIKGRRRQIARQLAMGRMMSQVPKATVVVTNPTHISIALKYEEGMSAPKVVAKGADYIALKIKEKAKEFDIPIVENKPLARMIFEKVELDDEIPVDMYEAVAEILAVVYKIKKK